MDKHLAEIVRLSAVANVRIDEHFARERAEEQAKTLPQGATVAGPSFPSPDAPAPDSPLPTPLAKAAEKIMPIQAKARIAADVRSPEGSVESDVEPVKTPGRSSARRAGPKRAKHAVISDDDDDNYQQGGGDAGADSKPAPTEAVAEPSNIPIGPDNPPVVTSKTSRAPAFKQYRVHGRAGTIVVVVLVRALGGTVRF